jgi:hypothetical protein
MIEFIFELILPNNERQFVYYKSHSHYIPRAYSYELKDYIRVYSTNYHGRLALSHYYPETMRVIADQEISEELETMLRIKSIPLEVYSNV